MQRRDPPLTGYVTKMYPRFSETFIINEILAHEAAGMDLHIFSLRPPVDGRFHESLARVRAGVTYSKSYGSRGSLVWEALRDAAGRIDGLWEGMDDLVRADLGDAMQALELALYTRTHGITHLHAHFGSVATTVTRLAARIAGISYSFTAHAKDIFHESVDPDDLRRKMRDAASVVTVSDFNLDYLRQTYGADAASTVRIYNGLDLDRFPFGSQVGRPPVIVSVGRLVEKKGFSVLIDACRILADSGRSFACRIVGSGPLEDDLRDRIERAGLAGHIELLGPLSQERVKEIVAGAAVFAAPCIVASDGNRDGLPTVLLEAMALGTACVASDVTGVPEIIREGTTGLLVRQHDAQQTAIALARLLDDVHLRSRLATAARALIESEFDIHRQTQKLREQFVTRRQQDLQAVSA